jgi:hypothetical protein
MHATISRRSLFAVAFGSWFATGCVSPYRYSRPWHGTFEQFLKLLPSIGSGQELIRKFGDPYDRQLFQPGDKGNQYLMNRLPRDQWDMKSTPPHLVGTMAVDTQLLLYTFDNGDALNPSGGILFVCVDQDDRIVGWMFDLYLDRYRSEVWLKSESLLHLK